jgi:cellobiose dehydrogenase (acceptor)
MSSALRRVKQRLPWTDRPSKDSKSYLTNGAQIAINALTNASNPDHTRFITANDKPNDKNHVSSYAEFFYLNGEKGGPMATYLVTASARKNFRLQLNTTVTRVLRNGDIALGVAVEATSPGGLTGTIKVTPKTGRVILSAGVFNTFKILLRSGIGPTDQLQLLTNTTEATKLPSKAQWLDLPVGYGLDDGPNFYIGVTLPHVETYPWDTLWNSTVDNPDIKKYLNSRSGPLAQLQPSLGPESWDTIEGEDGRKRVVQWDTNSGFSTQINGGGRVSNPFEHIRTGVLTCWESSGLHPPNLEPKPWSHISWPPLYHTKRRALCQYLRLTLLQRPG